VSELSDVATSRIRERVTHGVGHLTLDRPEAINALDLGMVERLRAVLDTWAGSHAVDLVVLDGAGERGFCAGGDVRDLARQITAGDPEGASRFFRAEYALNLQISRFGKPVVALADGVTMGGGIGLAGHAAVRVVTERSRLAMPETRIGFVPDVGGTLLLARAPGRLGEYLALTGDAMDAADAVHAGFADHLVPSERLDALREALESRADPSSPTEIVLLFDDTAGPSRLAGARPWIDDAFAADTVPQIVERLRARSEPAASDTADVLEGLSPTALTVALAAVRRARELADLRAVLEMEYGLVMWFVTTQPDLVEGVRAQLIDKDRSPRWSPPALADLPADTAERALAFRPATTLWGE
jgi:enoyl-CoA hydratase